MIKSYTDLEQSRKLAEILSLESADMSWVSNGLGKPFARTIPIKGDPEELCACWSLAALLGVLPGTINGIYCRLTIDKEDDVYNISYDDKLSGETVILYAEYSLIDACYEMILKLHKLNLL